MQIYDLFMTIKIHTCYIMAHSLIIIDDIKNNTDSINKNIGQNDIIDLTFMLFVQLLYNIFGKANRN